MPRFELLNVVLKALPLVQREPRLQGAKLVRGELPVEEGADVEIIRPSERGDADRRARDEEDGPLQRVAELAEQVGDEGARPRPQRGIGTDRDQAGVDAGAKRELVDARIELRKVAGAGGVKADDLGRIIAILPGRNADNLAAQEQTRDERIVQR